MSTKKGKANPSEQADKQPKEVNIKNLPLKRDACAPAKWADAFNITSRHDIPVATLRFDAVVFDEEHCERVEIARLQVSNNLVKQMIDTLSRHTGYYPEKPTD